VVRGKNQEKEERKRKIRKRDGARDMRRRKGRVQEKYAENRWEGGGCI
jgi:hypothetical protein